MTDIPYVGKELDIFAHATRWKKYWSSRIQPYLTGHVLEVGAGLGANTDFLKSNRISSWTCLEPDPQLVNQMRERFADQPQLADYCVTAGTTLTLEPESHFDAILYIDVLEHIANDHEEMARASRLLFKGGKIIVLAPAYQWLYTAFDCAIGHYRRYNKSTLSACTPGDCSILKLEYVDCVGILASVGNRLLLQRAMPDLNQILFWDRFLVPFSRLLDPLTFHLFGKSILGIWSKT